jgi:anti-anti-sigma regulatory factor/anti-sigma regulatory factor (Ser/Thr protein kinase)
MTQALTYRLERRFPVAVVRLVGELTVTTSQVARSAMLESMVEEPTSIVVDLSSVTSADHLAVRVFPDLAAQARRWPGAAVLLCGALRPVADALRRASVDREVAVHTSFQAALEVAAEAPIPLRVRQRLEPASHAPRVARELAADACSDWDLLGAATSAQIVSSELVTNAVRHAGTVMDLTVSLRDRHLRVSVRDRTGRMARRQSPSESDDHGRGLLIVEAVASAWGSAPTPDGKVVWAAVRVPPPRAASEPVTAQRRPGSRQQV